MPLPPSWRWIAYNRDTGVSLDFSSNSANETLTVTYKRHYIDGSTAGSIKANHEGSEQSDALTGSDVANGGTATFGGNNSEDRLGMIGRFEVKTDNASASGNVDLLIEWSTDGGTTWPSDAADWDPDEDARKVATVSLGGAQTVATNFRVGD